MTSDIEIFKNYGFRIIGSKSLMDKLILEFIWKFKGPRLGKKKILKNNKFRKLTVPNLKTYYKATVIQTV